MSMTPDGWTLAFYAACSFSAMLHQSPVLERTLIADLLCAVHRERLVTGITTGILPASATTGMLLGFGIRLGAPARAFQAIGALLADANRMPSLATVLGIVLHITATLLCGVAYIALVDDSEDHLIAWAITVGAGAAALLFIVARTFGGSIALALTPGNLMAIGVVIAITLPIGMRFAPSRV